jgi:hypothetical protein
MARKGGRYYVQNKQSVPESELTKPAPTEKEAGDKDAAAAIQQKTDHRKT